MKKILFVILAINIVFGSSFINPSASKKIYDFTYENNDANPEDWTQKQFYDKIEKLLNKVIGYKTRVFVFDECIAGDKGTPLCPINAEDLLEECNCGEGEELPDKTCKQNELVQVSCPPDAPEGTECYEMGEVVKPPEMYGRTCALVDGKYVASPFDCNADNLCGYASCDTGNSPAQDTYMPYIMHPIKAKYDPFPEDCKEGKLYLDGLEEKHEVERCYKGNLNNSRCETQPDCAGDIVNGKCHTYGFINKTLNCPTDYVYQSETQMCLFEDTFAKFVGCSDGFTLNANGTLCEQTLVVNKDMSTIKPNTTSVWTMDWWNCDSCGTMPISNLQELIRQAGGSGPIVSTDYEYESWDDTGTTITIRQRNGVLNDSPNTVQIGLNSVFINVAPNQVAVVAYKEIENNTTGENLKQGGKPYVNLKSSAECQNWAWRDGTKDYPGHYYCTDTNATATCPSGYTQSTNDLGYTFCYTSQCPSGYSDKGDGTCEQYLSEAPSNGDCPSGTTDNGDGTCTRSDSVSVDYGSCPSGYEDYSSTQCRQTYISDLICADPDFTLDWEICQKPLDEEYYYYTYTCPDETWTNISANKGDPGCKDDSLGGCLDWDKTTQNCEITLPECEDDDGSGTEIKCNKAICDLATYNMISYCENESCPDYEGVYEKLGNCYIKECPQNTVYYGDDKCIEK